MRMKTAEQIQAEVGRLMALHQGMMGGIGAPFAAQILMWVLDDDAQAASDLLTEADQRRMSDEIEQLKAEREEMKGNSLHLLHQLDQLWLRIEDAEIALNICDVGHDSEYWLRYPRDPGGVIFAPGSSAPR
jgi:hypothetical protein